MITHTHLQKVTARREDSESLTPTRGNTTPTVLYTPAGTYGMGHRARGTERSPIPSSTPCGGAIVAHRTTLMQ